MKLAKHQPQCAHTGCNVAASISWKDTQNDSSTWFFLTCDVCDDQFCKNHADTDPRHDDQNICVDCQKDQPSSIDDDFPNWARDTS